MFKFVVLFACMAAVYAEPKPGFLATAAAPLLAPATTIIRESPVITTSTIYRSAPFFAPAPVIRSSPLLAAAPAPFLTSDPIFRSPCAFGACGYGYGYGYGY